MVAPGVQEGARRRGGTAKGARPWAPSRLTHLFLPLQRPRRCSRSSTCANFWSRGARVEREKGGARAARGRHPRARDAPPNSNPSPHTLPLSPPPSDSPFLADNNAGGGFVGDSDAVAIAVSRYESGASSGAACAGGVYTSDDDACLLLPPFAKRSGPRRTIYRDPANVTAALVTCGGLCPGLNDVVQNIVFTLADYGVPEVGDGREAGVREGGRAAAQCPLAPPPTPPPSHHAPGPDLWRQVRPARLLRAWRQTGRTLARGRRRHPPPRRHRARHLEGGRGCG